MTERTSVGIDVIYKAQSWDRLVLEVRLTGHLSSLEVPEMLHRHLQDVRLLQL